MAFRSDILAGRAVILVTIQDTIDRQLRTMRSKLRAFSNSISTLGGDLFRLGAIGTIGSILPIRDFIAFQDQMLFLQTKLQATDTEMKNLEATIRQLGRTTSFTPKQVAEAATEFAKAGFTITETIQSLQPALDLARAGQVDISTSTTILANSLRTFQKGAEHAEEFASKFITAARLGTLNIVDLSEALKESSSTFNLLGVGLDEALALITQLSLASLKGTKAGTSLNRAYLKLADSAKELAGIGIFLTDEDFEKPIQVFTKLQDAIARLGKKEVVNVLTDIFQIRGARAAGAILIQGLDNLQGRLDEIRASSDEARIAAKKLDSALGGIFRRALSAFQELSISIGSGSEGPLSKFGEGLRVFFTNLSQLAQTSPMVVQTLLLMGPAALIAGAGLLTLTFLAGNLANALTPLIALWALIFPLFFKLISLPGLAALTLGKLALGNTGLVDSFNVLKSTVGDLGPILDTLKLAFGFFLEGRIDKAIETVKIAFQGLTEIVGAGLTEAFGKLKEQLQPTIDLLKDAAGGIKDLFNGLIPIIDKVADKLAGIIKDLGIALKGTVEDALGPKNTLGGNKERDLERLKSQRKFTEKAVAANEAFESFFKQAPNAIFKFQGAKNARRQLAEINQKINVLEADIAIANRPHMNRGHLPPVANPSNPREDAAARAEQRKNNIIVEEGLRKAALAAPGFLGRMMGLPVSIPSGPGISSIPDQLSLGESLAISIAKAKIARGDTEITQKDRDLAALDGKHLTDAMKKEMLAGPTESTFGEALKSLFPAFSVVADTIMADNKGAKKGPPPGMIRQVAAVVGSFSGTRGNLIKAMGNENEKRDTLLQEIADNTKDGATFL